MISVSQAGFTVGMTMRKKIRISPAPSIFAASSMAFGTLSINCFIRNSPSGEPNAGIINAR